MYEFERDYRSDKERKRRRKRARRMALMLIFLIIFVLLAGVGAIVYYVSYFNRIPGSYIAKEDYTDEVVANVAVWMADIEGADIDVNFVKSHAQSMEVDVVLDFAKEELTSGTYKIAVDENSYNDCSQKAQKLATNCMLEVISKKLVDRNYQENITADEAAGIVSGVLGCSMEEYLQTNGLSFMPSYDEVNSKVAVNGTYRMTMQNITRSSSEGTVKEKYIIDKDAFILPQQAIIYRKQVTE